MLNVLLSFFTVLTQLLVADGVIIEDNTPTTIAPGESKVVNIGINKGSVEGFAKLELEFPDGLEALPVQTNGASFTFVDQKAKFIWMTLPNDQEFNISYELKAKSYAQGNKIIKGTFSYIKENQRIDYELQSKVVNVTSDEAATTADTSTPEPETTPEPAMDGGQGMRCVRTVTDLGQNEYLVSLNVLENELDGFDKIQ
ncbi:MAG: hypothetical protein AAF193_05985 [Bacteroidota bacterium]